jgi:hypothetical protein
VSDIKSLFDSDKLERIRFVNTLCKAIDALSAFEKPPAGRVIAVDAPWGSGKTWIAEKLQDHLKQHHEIETCIYINAFEFDFHHDPFVILVSAILGAIDKEGAATKELKSAAIEVVKTGLPLAVKGVAKKLVENYVGEDFKEFAEGLAEKSDKAIGKLLDSFAETREAAANFKENLQRATKKSKGPIVIVIDELDRCRPTFALEMLERVKHLFDVPGVVFILFVHMDALVSAIRKTYGLGADAESYLKKFISIRMQLPSRKSAGARRTVEDAAQFFGSFIESEFPPKDNRHQNFNEALAELAPAFSMTLRDIQSTILLGRLMLNGRRVDAHVLAYAVCLWQMDRIAAKTLLTPGAPAQREEANRLLPFLDGGNLIQFFHDIFNAGSRGEAGRNGISPQSTLEELNMITRQLEIGMVTV